MAASMRLRHPIQALYQKHLIFPKFIINYQLNIVRGLNSLKTKSTEVSGGHITTDSKVDAVVASKLDEDHVGKSGHISYKSHPGIIQRRRSQLPTRLVKAIKILLERYPIKTLLTEKEKLLRYLQQRQVPLSSLELTERARAVEDDIHSKEGNRLQGLTGPDLLAATETLRQKVLNRLRHTTYHWKPMEYDAVMSYIYMVGCVASNYSVLMQCFTEISQRDPDFKPTTVYNFGSRVGAAIWAADAMWKGIGEYYCVDASAHMNTLAQLLLQDANEHVKSTSIKGVYFRQFEPSSKNKFSLVVSPYMLIEQPTQQDRLALVQNLWEMTEDYMVLVENGTGAGFKLINEAREYLTQLWNSTPDQQGHVFAPCPHDRPCPRVAINQLCLTKCVVNEPDFAASKSNEKEKRFEKYTYLILKKGTRQEVASWPRVVEQIKAQKHTHCHLCLPSGELQHIIISKGKFERHLYKCARNIEQGDFLPVSLSRHSETQAETQPECVTTDTEKSS
ncbi:unnamed protein product [Lymnaea stagnalis]|uniref:Methyltransferase-like protein 17, mitochondrial n=1 Tax=Lymnaea stagnalis TaxID=6523 RepID=A0AAV2IC12_LYMST